MQLNDFPNIFVGGLHYYSPSFCVDFACFLLFYSRTGTHLGIWNGTSPVISPDSPLITLSRFKDDMGVQEATAILFLDYPVTPVTPKKGSPPPDGQRSARLKIKSQSE
jgi:hypothetical protein